MNLFEDAISKAKTVIDAAGKKTNDVVSVQKQKFELASMESKLSKDYETFGRLTIDIATDDAALSDEARALAGEIREKEAEIEALRREIYKAQGKKICPACGVANISAAHFCYACGKELVNAAPAGDEPQSDETQNGEE